MKQSPGTTLIRLLDVGRDLHLGESLVPPETVRTVHAARIALTDDGRATEEALRSLVGQQRIAFHLAGAVEAGTSLGGIYDFPQGARIHRISAHARVAPTSGPFTGRILVDGVVADVGSIQPGTTSIATGASITVPPGGVVTLNVTSDGGAEDVTVSVFFTNGSST